MLKVYSIPSCFHCQDAKKKLKENKIEFEELDAIDNLDYLTSIGQYSLPVIIKNDKVITLNDALNEK